LGCAIAEMARQTMAAMIKVMRFITFEKFSVFSFQLSDSAAAAEK
jgi:hypothetical protein